MKILPLITVDELRRLAPGLSTNQLFTYSTLLDAAMREFQITTKKRRCAFIAQLLHESQGLTRWQENLNYKSKRLLEIFPRRFRSLTEADAYAHRPEAIANRVYANKGGNGNEASGDGWRFRGRGPIQLTLRDNYRLYAELLPGSLLEHDPARAAQPEFGFRVAACFWHRNGLNELADRLNMRGDELERQVLVQITRRVNGGTYGLTERINLFRIAKQVMHADDAVAPQSATPTDTAAPVQSPALEPSAPQAAETKPAEPDVDLLDAAVTSPKTRELLWPRIAKHFAAGSTLLAVLYERHRFATIVVSAVLLAGVAWLAYHNRKRLKGLIAKVLQ